MSAVLEVRDLTKRFGGIHAVDGVSFEVDEEDEILGITGFFGPLFASAHRAVLWAPATAAKAVA